MTPPNLKRFIATATATAALCVLAYGAPLQASDRDDHGATFRDAIGSWFGRAVPLNPLCPPGSPGCPIPPEIIMQFTLNADGTMIAIDSNFFFALHTPAHGQWERKDARSVKAAFTLMQSDGGHFIGSFKNNFTATVVNPDEMRGTISARLYAYINPLTGAAFVDADGFPSPSPLAPASECSTTPGCLDLGAFQFIVRRVKVQ